MLKMYAIYDRLAKCYAAPFVLNEMTAQRSFKWMQNEKEKMELEDKEAHEIASWDEQTGLLIPNQTKNKVYDFDPEEVNKDEISHSV